MKCQALPEGYSAKFLASSPVPPLPDLYPAPTLVALSLKLSLPIPKAMHACLEVCPSISNELFSLPLAAVSPPRL